MPLSEERLQANSGVITRLRPADPRPLPAGPSAQERLDELEARLDRLETGQISALNLVREALNTIRNNQARQHGAQSRAVGRLAEQLSQCEAALAQLDASQKRDDETMRERLFDMAETMETVRALASAAVRPVALRRLERTLGEDLATRTESLRAELGERISEAVEAAESRSATALDTLENDIWDDLTELARRFDGLAEAVVELQGKTEADTAPVRVAAREQALCAPQTVSSGLEIIDLYSEEEDDPMAGFEDEEAASYCDEALSEVLAFPSQPDAVEKDEEWELPENVGAVLTAAAQRADEAEVEFALLDKEEEAETDPAARPERRLMANTGSAFMAVCVIGALSLLAGPVLGPNLQSAPPAYAEDSANWKAVSATPQAIDIPLRLEPTLKATITQPGVGKGKRATSER